MRPRVSVVIPVFNRAKTILPTLESVRQQTMPDFECIIVDDGSTDGEQLREVVDALSDERFRYVRRENGGASAARNTGIEEAVGGIVSFLDSDDRWLPEKLERDIEAGADRRVVFSAVAVERARRIVGKRPTVHPRPSEPMAEYLACRGGWTATSTMSLPHSIARDVPFDETVKFGGDDTDFAIRIAAMGTDFHMLPISTVVLGDDETGDRLSRSNDWRSALAWLDKIRPLMTGRARYAYRGWHVARMAADAGYPSKAIGFYAAALARGAFSPQIAAQAFLEIARQCARACFR